MTTTDYIFNGLFILLVLRQTRESELDRRSWLLPLILLTVVASQFLHSIPTAGNDLQLIATLALAGLSLGLASALATKVRIRGTGPATAQVGWLAGALLIAGIGSRLVFAFLVTHGAGAQIREFSIAHHLTPAAWPTALVLMAVLEVTTRILVVQVRGRRLVAIREASVAAAAAMA